MTRATTLKGRTVDSGTTDTECTRCTWMHPSGHHLGHGTPDRPGGADHLDAAMPHVSEHIASTGHRVRVITTTYHRDGRVEQSALLVGPRATDPTTPRRT